MRDYDEIFRSLKYPTKPRKKPPVREDFSNNTAWGAALDAYDVQFAEEMKEYKIAIDAYHAESKNVDTEFWKDVYAELGWDRLPIEVAQALQAHAWSTGHSSGYMEVYNHACDLDEITTSIINHYHHT